VPDETYTAIGVRSADSLNRHTSIKMHGSSNEKRRTFSCLRLEEVRLLHEIKRKKVNLLITNFSDVHSTASIIVPKANPRSSAGRLRANP
jgi:hypothetical protein